jgi:hypothetical protein
VRVTTRSGDPLLDVEQLRLQYSIRTTRAGTPSSIIRAQSVCPVSPTESLRKIVYHSLRSHAAPRCPIQKPNLAVADAERMLGCRVPILC